MLNRNRIIAICFLTISVCTNYCLNSYDVERSYTLLREGFMRQEKMLFRLQNSQEDDEALLDVYSSIEALYKKAIEVTALYCCHDGRYAYDRLVADIGYDVLRLVKGLMLYIPKLYKSKKLSSLQKMKQVFYISTLISILALWFHKCWKQSRFSWDIREYQVPLEYGVSYNPRPRPPFNL